MSLSPRRLIACLLALPSAVLSGCSGLSDERAVRLVEEYNRRLIEAFRLSDFQVAAAVAGPNELKKLAGLVGVKADVGVALDSQLIELHVLGVERHGDEVAVSTDERWTYRDRRIGTGEQVGEESKDHYRMRYFLARQNERWVVDRVEWAAPPEVSRAAAPVPADAGGAP